MDVHLVPSAGAFGVVAHGNHYVVSTTKEAAESATGLLGDLRKMLHRRLGHRATVSRASPDEAPGRVALFRIDPRTAKGQRQKRRFKKIQQDAWKSIRACLNKAKKRIHDSIVRQHTSHPVRRPPCGRLYAVPLRH